MKRCIGWGMGRGALSYHALPTCTTLQELPHVELSGSSQNPDLWGFMETSLQRHGFWWTGGGNQQGLSVQILQQSLLEGIKQDLSEVTGVLWPALLSSTACLGRELSVGTMGENMYVYINHSITSLLHTCLISHSFWIPFVCVCVCARVHVHFQIQLIKKLSCFALEQVNNFL